MPPDTLQVIPDPTLDVSQYLFHHPGVDFIWTTGGPKAVAAANEAGKPCLSVGAGNAPVYIHRSADVPMAVVDMLISKTFDASVICPAEQTCVIDDADLGRDGRRAPADGRAPALRRGGGRAGGASRSTTTAHAELRRARPVVRRPRRARRLRGRRPTTRSCSRRCRPTSTTLAAHPLVHEKLMPVLGLVRSPSVEHALARGRARHRARRPRPHLGGLRDRRGRDRRVRRRRPHRPHPRQRADRGRRARRRLQLDDADLLARLRHLGRLDHHRQRQLPQPAQHQDRLAPADAAAVVPRPVGHLLQPRRARAAAQPAHAPRRCSSPTPTPRRAASPTRCAATSPALGPRVRRDRARADARRRSAPASTCSRSCGRT